MSASISSNSDKDSPEQNPKEKRKGKTGPSPKYGSGQTKKMVSMRLSPDALNSIKEASQRIFRDSQADVIERVMRFFTIDAMERICRLSEKSRISPSSLLESALDLYEENRKLQIINHSKKK